MLIYCEKLYDFHDYMLQLLNELGVESTSDMFQSIGYQRINCWVLQKNKEMLIFTF